MQSLLGAFHFLVSLLIKERQIGEDRCRGGDNDRPWNSVDKYVTPTPSFLVFVLITASWAEFGALRDRRRTFFALNESHRFSSNPVLLATGFTASLPEPTGTHPSTC
jgi:hypothetical protein